MKKNTKKKTTKKKVVNSGTHIIAILDRSGSMSAVQSDAIGGFNTFLTSQKAIKDKSTMSVVLFDDKYEPLYGGKDVDLSEVNELTTKTFVPRGSTALYDAIGKSVNSYNAKWTTNKAKRPEKVLVIIVTDGEENSSKEYSLEQINKLISDRKADKWQFMFLCATEDAFKTGASLGISRGNTMAFQNTSLGNQVMYAKMSASTISYRGMSTQDPQFSVAADSLLSNEE